MGNMKLRKLKSLGIIRLLGALLLGVIRLLGVFGLSAGGKFDTVFFGHAALSFGIGNERRFYYEVDTSTFVCIE